MEFGGKTAVLNLKSMFEAFAGPGRERRGFLDFLLVVGHLRV